MITVKQEEQASEERNPAKAASLAVLPLHVQQFVQAFLEQIHGWTTALAAGRLTVDAWYQLMSSGLARNHMAAFMLGMGGTQVTPEMIELIRKTMDFHLGYLDNFARVIRAGGGEFNPRWYWRAGLYGLSTKTSYWEGEVTRQAGRPLPLPAMPAQGTTCLTNCGCEWEIRVIDEAKGDFDAYWRRTKDDSCQVCLQREEDWSPFRIRGMKPQPARRFKTGADLAADPRILRRKQRNGHNPHDAMLKTDVALDTRNLRATVPYVEANLALERVKHLGPQHDQASHGSRGGAGARQMSILDQQHATMIQRQKWGDHVGDSATGDDPHEDKGWQEQMYRVGRAEQSIRWYTRTENASAVNRAMTGRRSHTEETRKHEANIRDAFELPGSTLSEGLIVHRGTGVELPDQFTTGSFLSTSVSQPAARNFGSRLSRFEMPAGAKALFAGRAEGEVIFPPGVTYQRGADGTFRPVEGRFKHLPGKHEQQTHGRGGGSSSESKRGPQWKKQGERVWQGSQQEGERNFTKIQTGAMGEAVAERAMADLTNGSTFSTMNAGLNNAPIDIAGDHHAVEVKAAFGINSKTAQHWRATSSTPGKREREVLKTMTKEEKRKHHDAKRAAAIDRKYAAVDRMSKAAGADITPATMTMIFSPDGRRADVFFVEGFHQRLPWKQYATDDYYVGTYDFDPDSFFSGKEYHGWLKALAHKHLQGKHRQDAHGYRYGSVPSVERAREMRAAGTWDDYRRRAADRGLGGSGLARGDVARGEALGAAQSHIAAERSKYAVAKTEHQRAYTEFAAQSKRQGYWAKRQENARERMNKRDEQWQKADDDYQELSQKLMDRDGNSYYDPIHRRGDAFADYQKLDDLRDRKENAAERYRDERDKYFAGDAKQNAAVADYMASMEKYEDSSRAHKEARQEYLDNTADARRLVMRQKRAESAELRKDLVASENKYDRDKAAAKAEYESKKADVEAFKAGAGEEYWTEAGWRSVWEAEMEAGSQLQKVRRGEGSKQDARDKLYQRTEVNRTPGLNTDASFVDATTGKKGEVEIDDWEVKRWKDGHDEALRFVGDNTALHNTPIEIGRADGRGREYTQEELSYRASYGGNSIDVYRGTGTGTVVHEMGHWVEGNDPAIRYEVNRFLDTRTAGESSRRLSEVTGNSSYRKSEVTTPDKFIDAYIGKRYSHGVPGLKSTEVLSMGLQMFYENPMRLARLDPDMFDLVYAVVRMGT